MDNKEVDYCKCENSSGVYTRMDGFGFWYMCSDCDKVVEDSYKYFNEAEDEY
ncbi:MAG TPA: hypothetical protein VIM70_14210 [Clostridium sp.]|uniref:hypothetical protein n=1 Tax=Clostridium sp. TaxID=1506 RepID=UPI002F93BFD2